MFNSKKTIIFSLTIIILIFLFTAMYLFSLPEPASPTSSDTEPASSEVISQSEQAAQAEIIYYDKSWYDDNIISVSDVILAYSSSDPAYIEQTVFVGDSNTEGLSLFGHLPAGNVIGKHSMPVQGVTTEDYQLIAEDNPETEEDESQYITMLQVLANIRPQRIILNFGTNNAGKDASVSYFVNTYSDMINCIKAVCPDTHIVVASVLPVCAERDNYNIRQDTIDKFNISLAELCRTYGYGFLNYNEVFKNTVTGYGSEEYYSVDGIHLNGNGYRLLLDYAANHQYNISR